MAAKAKKRHLPGTTTLVTQEQDPMPSLKVKKPKKTSRGK
jgi:hypothetical protein